MFRFRDILGRPCFFRCGALAHADDLSAGKRGGLLVADEPEACIRRALPDGFAHYLETVGLDMQRYVSRKREQTCKLDARTCLAHVSHDAGLGRKLATDTEYSFLEHSAPRTDAALGRIIGFAGIAFRTGKGRFFSGIHRLGLPGWLLLQRVQCRSVVRALLPFFVVSRVIVSFFGQVVYWSKSSK